MSSLTSPKKANDAVSSLEPELENWDKVFEAFFLSNLRWHLNFLLEENDVRGRRMASGRIGIETFEE